MALKSTQPLTEMSTRDISWGVMAAIAYSWQTYHLHVATVLKSGSLNLLEPSGPVQACVEIALPFLHYSLYANYVTVDDLHIRHMTLKNSMQYTKEEERRVDQLR